jgi:imidazolonepropionase-like amidohydrolase
MVNMRANRILFVMFVLITGLVSTASSFAQSSLKAEAKVKAIRVGKLWDGKGRVWTNAIVIVEGERVREVTTDAKRVPTGAEVLDLTKYYVLPGLIDVHTHMTLYADETLSDAAGRSVPMLKQVASNSAAVEVFVARKGAMRTLEAGVTTVRDLGSDQYMDIAMRDLINSKEMVGPRMFVCGYGLSVTSTAYKGSNSSVGAPPAGGIADGVPEVLRVVRQQVAAGADVIKMFASTGTDDDTSGYQTYGYEEIKAAVDAAHQFGKKIAIHSYGPDGARDAVRAGTDSLEHATDMDDATIAEMAKRGTYYVPTIDHNRYYVENGSKIGYTPGFEPRSQAFIARNLETARKAHRAGVKFAMGSDSVYSMFGQNTRELGWFVRAGMSPEEALKTATSNAAELLGRGNELGAVAPGYFADLVAIEGDPTSDIGVVVEKVKWVMKGGAVVVDKNRAVQ